MMLELSTSMVDMYVFYDMIFFLIYIAISLMKPDSQMITNIMLLFQKVGNSFCVRFTVNARLLVF